MNHTSRFLLIVCLTAVLLACSKKIEHAAAAAVPPAGAIAQVSGAAQSTITSKMNTVGNASSLEGSADAMAGKTDKTNDAGTAATITQRLSSSALTATPKGRQLVRTAQLTFTVKDVYLVQLAIEDAVAAHDGFVASSAVNSAVTHQEQYPAEDGKALRVNLVDTTGQLTVRVPSAKAQAFLRSIASHIQTLEQRTLAANDVQFDLLRQQLEVARAQATAQDLAQLTQQANQQINKNQTIAQRRQAAIDGNEAQLAKLTLADQVDFATLTLNLSQSAFVRKTIVTDMDTALALHRPSFAARATQAMADGWGDVRALAIALLSAWPKWLALLAIVLLWRKFGIGAQLRNALRPATVKNQTQNQTQN